MSSRWMALTLATVFLGLAVPSSAFAAEVRSGDTVTIGPEEVVNDDLYAFGSNVLVLGTVRGDVIAAGSAVTIAGHVTGSVLAAGSNVGVTGPVDGSVRIAGNLLTVTAPVASDVLLAGSTASINPPASVGRDALTAGGNISVQAPVARNVQASGGTLTLGSSVGGSVDARVNELVLSSGASIAGPVTYVSPNNATVDNGARTAQALQRTPPPERAPNPWEVGGVDVLAWLRGFVGIALFGTVLLLLFPYGASAITPIVGQRWLSSLGLGFALVVGVPLAALIIAGLGLLVGGWWIGLIVVGLYALMLVVGYAAFAHWLGTATLRLARTDARPIVALLLGLLILAMVLLLPVIGLLCGFGATLVGTGAVALYTWQAYRRTSTKSPPKAEEEPAAPLRAVA